MKGGDWVCNGLVQRVLDKKRVFFWLNVFEPQFPPLKNGESLIKRAMLWGFKQLCLVKLPGKAWVLHKRLRTRRGFG